MGAAAFAAPAAVAGCGVAVARGFAGAVTLLATAPDRTDVDPPLTASLCQVPTEAKVLSNVAEKYTRYTLPPPQKCPLVAQIGRGGLRGGECRYREDRGEPGGDRHRPPSCTVQEHGAPPR